MFLILVLLFLVLVVLFTAVMLFRKAFGRPQTPDPQDDDAFQRSRWFAFGPLVKPGAAWLKEQVWQQETLQAEDGAVLQARGLQGQPGRPAMLLFHDYGASPLVDFCLTARWAIRQGWSVLLPDQRAHGASGGRYTSMGLREGEDCLLWAQRVTELLGPGCSLVLGGVGLGGAAVLSALGLGLPENVRALLLDSFYPSLKGEMKYMLRIRLRMRTFPLLQMLYLLGRICWGRAPGRLDGVSALKANERIPVFFAQGREDSMTPYDAAQQAYEACSAPKVMFTGEKSGHGACSFTEAERYFTELEDFLAAQLGVKLRRRSGPEKTKNRP